MGCPGVVSGNNYVTLLRNIESRTPRIPSELHLSSACRRLLAGLLKRNPVRPADFAPIYASSFACAMLAERENILCSLLLDGVQGSFVLFDLNKTPAKMICKYMGCCIVSVR